MSDRTRALENAASRALLDFVRDPTDAKADASDNVVWRICEAVIAKVNENLMGEMEGIRRLTFAKPDETTTTAVRRLIRERDGIMKKYRKAQDVWDDERAKTANALEAAQEFLDSLAGVSSDIHLVRGGTRCERESACARCRLAFALEDLEEVR